jgi:hypothetical protein
MIIPRRVGLKTKVIREKIKLKRNKLFSKISSHIRNQRQELQTIFQKNRARISDLSWSKCPYFWTLINF